MSCKTVALAVLLAVICHASLATATCKDGENSVGRDVIKALDEYVQLTIRTRYEHQTRKVISHTELIMGKSFDKTVDGITAYYTVHKLDDAEDDPNYNNVFLKVIDPKTGKRDLTMQHVESILDNVLAKKCRAYVDALKGPMSHAGQDDTCYLDINYRMHLCKMLLDKQHKIAKVMFKKATNVVQNN